MIFRRSDGGIRATLAAGGSTRALAVFRLPIRHTTERRPVLLLAAGALFAAVFVVRQAGADSGDALALLYVIPIALVALDLGFVAGIAAAMTALLLVGVWMLTLHVHVGAVGVLTRAVAYLAVGMIAGRFGDRMRDAQERQHLLLQSGLALAHLKGIDGLAATVADAASAICPSHRARVEIATDAAPVAETGTSHSGSLEVPLEVRGFRYGTLFLEGHGLPDDEDRASVGILALQAAVAAESCRLLEREREHAAIRAQLQDARRNLERRGAEMRDVLARQESERTQVAWELHEQAAQTLAAVLLGLGAVERRQRAGDGGLELADLRSEVSATLGSLRSLAVMLRPTTLPLGARIAIQELLTQSGIEHVTTALDTLADLSQDTASVIYRIVEESLAAVGPVRSAEIRADPLSRELTIDLDGAVNAIEPERLTVLHARVDAIGGTVTSSTRRLRAIVPVHSGEPGVPAAPVIGTAFG